jgi:hypothetical protein
MDPEESENPEVARIGLAFARSLAEGRYEDAFKLLAPSLLDDLQPRDLMVEYEQMTSYWDAPANRIYVVHADPPTAEWPGKGDNDMGWTYVSIELPTASGGVNLEAVFVRVARIGARRLIAQIEWGRP